MYKESQILLAKFKLLLQVNDKADKDHSGMNISASWHL